MMSSDSSSQSKGLGDQIQKLKNVIDSSFCESEEPNANKNFSVSQQSIKSIPKQDIEQLGSAGYKSSVTMDMYNKDDSHNGTGTTQNSMAPTVITAVLRDLRDDVIHSSTYHQSGPVSLVNGDRTIAVIEGDNVYVQKKNKFIPVPREKALSSLHDQSFWAYQDKKLGHSPLDTAVILQKAFTPLSSICFGLLGGVALLQMFLVHHLIKVSPDQEWGFFLQSYSRFAEVTPVLFYILLAVCIVSILDRAPIHQGNIVCQQSWLVVAVYSITLVLTLSCAPYDSMIALHPYNKTLFQDQLKSQVLVSEWQLLNTLRCFFAIFGWISFSLILPRDLLYEELLGIKEYEQRKLPSPALSRNFLN